MHLAFRNTPSIVSMLEIICKDPLFSIPNGKVFLRRYGVFVQADCCAKNNISNENIIPTFTCNFLASSDEEAQSITAKVVDKVFEYDKSLHKSFLRVRCEAQLSFLKFSQQRLQLSNVIPVLFPQSVSFNEYYDAHIHVLGLTFENTLELWSKVAEIGLAQGMPIIINKTKIITANQIKPFYTKRWYNTTLKAAMESLKNVYSVIVPKLTALKLEVALIPEFEVTTRDPDCQVTDQGWMPTPECVFEFTKEHVVIPTDIKNIILSMILHTTPNLA